MIDHLELTRLQQAILRTSLENAPQEVTKYAIVATAGGTSMAVKLDSPIQFALPDEATSALRSIFLMHEAAGQPLRAIRAEMAENPDATWSMAMEYDYV